MLSHLRDYFPKWLIVTFLGLIALLVIGASLYSPSAVANPVVATVNRAKIKRMEWEFSCEKVKELSQLGQRQLTPEEEKILRAQVLEQLIIKQVLQHSFYKQGYRMHPDDVLNYIKNNPVLRENFSTKQRLLSGHSKLDFLNQVREHQLNMQCMGSIMQSAFVLPEEVRSGIALMHQSRDFSYLELKPEQFSVADEALSLDEMQAYYSQQLSDFRMPERVGIDYIVLNQADILTELKANNSSDLGNQLLSNWQETVERLTALVKKHPYSLSEAAAKLNVCIHTTDLFTQNDGSGPITRHPNVLKIAFDPVMRDGRNSSLIQLDSKRIMVLRVKQYEPLRLAAFEEVESQVCKQLGVAKAKEAVKKCSETYVAELKKNSSARPAFSKSMQWRKVEKTRLDNKHIPLAVLQAAFFSTSLKDQVNSVVLPNGDCLVIHLSKIRYGKLSQLTDKERELIRDGLVLEKNQLDYQCYVEASKRDVNITLLDK